MYFQYGSHRHPDNEVNLASFQQFPVFSGRGERRTTRYRMTLNGELQYATQAELTTKIGEIVDAYSTDGYEACLYQDDGTPTRHRLADLPNSVTGTRVMYRDWPKGDAAEYATKRSFRIILEAEYLEPDSQITSAHETLAMRGAGGPIWEMVTPVRGVPRRIYRSRYSPQKVIQSGNIVGLSGYPLLYIPGPIFPQWEHQDLRDSVMGTPKWHGRMYLDWPISYSYHFTLPVPQTAAPTVI